MPESGATDAPRPERAPPSFRRTTPEQVARAVRRLVRGARAAFPSQAAFRAALLDAVRREEPLATIGGARLRRLLVGVPGVRLSVRYAERPGRPLPTACPVCGAELAPIRNRTLTDGVVTLGRRCVRCDYWTHGVRRVPVRYLIANSTGRRAERRTR